MSSGRWQYGPRRNKTCLWGFLQSETQTSLLSYRDLLENWNFACSKFRYDTFQNANYNGADQSAQMRRLVCAFVVSKLPKTGFLTSRHIWKWLFSPGSTTPLRRLRCWWYKHTLYIYLVCLCCLTSKSTMFKSCWDNFSSSWVRVDPVLSRG